MAHVRYRFKGQFISGAKAVRLSKLKGPAKRVTSERVALHSPKTVKFVRGFVKPADLQRGMKIPRKPAIPPASAPPPAAVPPPPPARIPGRRITPDRKFIKALDDFEASAEAVSPAPDPEEAAVLHDKWEAVATSFNDLDEPSDDQSDDFDRAKDLWADIAPFEEEGWDREFFGYEMLDGEDGLLDEFQTLDIDDDTEYPRE